MVSLLLTRKQTLDGDPGASDGIASETDMSQNAVYMSPDFQLSHIVKKI